MEVTRVRGVLREGSHDGISLVSLSEQRDQSSLTLCRMSTQQESRPHTPGREVSPQPDHVVALISEAPASTTEGRVCCVSHPAYGVLFRQPALPKTNIRTTVQTRMNENVH